MDTKEKKVLVAYFSCTGTTEKVAKIIAQSVKGDLYRITPKKEYTPADLNWQDSSSRSSVEMRDTYSRPALADPKADIQAYDVIFIGYPIWWYTCPTIINTFMECHDFKGKTVIPFATSGGSSVADSARSLQELYGKEIVWKQGKLLNKETAAIKKWAEEVVNQ